MKKILFLLIFFGFSCLKSQVNNLTRIKLINDDSTIQVVSGDTTYIFNAWVLTHMDGGITSLTMTCKTYSNQNASWLTYKDTIYTWNMISVTTTNNLDYQVCKPNENLLKVCLGRLDVAVRRKFIFQVTGSNGILTKEFNY